MKAILATGELATLTNVYKASVVCMMAGSDFIKTSTGKEVENATLPVSLVMCRAIREYLLRTDGYKVGFKPAGGIATAKQSLSFQALMKEVRACVSCRVHASSRAPLCVSHGSIERCCSSVACALCRCCCCCCCCRCGDERKLLRDFCCQSSVPLIWGVRMLKT